MDIPPPTLRTGSRSRFRSSSILPLGLLSPHHDVYFPRRRRRVQAVLHPIHTQHDHFDTLRHTPTTRMLTGTHILPKAIHNAFLEFTALQLSTLSPSRIHITSSLRGSFCQRHLIRASTIANPPQHLSTTAADRKSLININTNKSIPKPMTIGQATLTHLCHIRHLLGTSIDLFLLLAQHLCNTSNLVRPG